MLHVREGLNRIQGYVKRRMDRLRSELKSLEDHIVTCPACTKFALVIDGEANKCHFCPRRWDAEELAQEYASEILNFSWHDLTEGGTDPTVECPYCDMRTLILNAYIAATPERSVNICFNCAEVFKRLDSCTLCDRHFVPDEDETVCGNCWRERIASD